MKPVTLSEATLWLAEHGVADIPTRIHDRATGDDGAPRLAADFWNWLLRDESDHSWTFQVVQLTVDEPCPRQHPIRAKGEPRCEMCDDALGWKKTRPMYVRPFMAALERLRSVPPTSPAWPPPRAIVLAYMRSGYDIGETARAIGQPIIGPDHARTVEAAILLAVRRLIERWSSGPIERPRGISENQAQAEAA